MERDGKDRSQKTDGKRIKDCLSKMKGNCVSGYLQAFVIQSNNFFKPESKNMRLVFPGVCFPVLFLFLFLFLFSGGMAIVWERNLQTNQEVMVVVVQICLFYTPQGLVSCINLGYKDAITRLHLDCLATLLTVVCVF